MSPLTHRLGSHKPNFIVYLKKPGPRAEWRFAGAASTPTAALNLLCLNSIKVLPSLIEQLGRDQIVQGPTWKVVA